MYRPPASRRPAPRRPTGVRTYLVFAIGGAAGAGRFVRPLGTVAAPHRSMAREAARALYPHVAPDELRVAAAGAAPAGLLADALAADAAAALTVG